MKNIFLVAGLALLSQATAVDPKSLNQHELITSELVANETARLNELISSTQRSLDQQKKLRDLLQEYETLQVHYMQHSDDNDLLYQLIKSAYTILQNIQLQHLENFFEPEFLRELAILSKPARKSAIPQP